MLSKSCSAPALGSLAISPHSETLRGGAEVDFSPLIWTSWTLVCKLPSCARFTPRCLNLKDGGFERKVPGSQRFRRAQSENNLVHSVKTMEAATHGNAKRQRSTTPVCSEMHELELPADDLLRLERMACYPGLDEVTEEESDDLEVSDNPAENSVLNYHIQLAENSIPCTQIQLAENSIPNTQIQSAENYLPETQIQSGPPHSLQKSYRESSYSVNNEERSINENPSISRRVSGISAMADGEIYSSVGVGSNGVALVCRTRGSKPGHVSETELEDGLGIGKGGGKGIPGGGGRGGGSSGADSNSIDIYYQKMLEANPGNPLLLRNYAKFLHEVQHDMRKAEEYCGRAILASPGDGDVLSLYAKLIWEGHQDPSRAKAYFDQAVQAAPDDCYVLASYAHFLWNSKDEEEDGDDPDPQHNVPGQAFVGSVSVATC